MGEIISKSDARRACELIFNEVCTDLNEDITDSEKQISFYQYKHASTETITRIHSYVLDVLSSDSWIQKGKISTTWWIDRLAGDTADDLLIQRVYESKDFRKQVRSVFNQLISDRMTALNTNQVEGTSSETVTLEGWTKEPADLYIGPFGVNLPGPEAIEVQENFGISGYQGLRTDSDPVIREPNSRIDIIIDAVFPDIHSLNTKLRPIIAHLRASPLTVLQSSLLNSVMLRSLQEEELFQLLVEAQKNWEANKGRVSEMLAERGLQDKDTLDGLEAALKTDSEIGRKISLLSEEYQASPNAGKIPGPLPRVPVMFTGMQVQSIDDLTHAYRVRFSFSFMNDLAVSEDGLRFLDAKGNETDSIWECAWLKRYLDIGWLEDNTSMTYLPEYPKSKKPMVFKYDSQLAPFSVDPVIEDGDNIIVESIVCGFQNKVATIPLLGQTMPSYQYLGRKNAQVEIMLNCSLKGVDSLTRVKSSLEKNIHETLKYLREDYIDLVLPIANMMGFSKFAISGARTMTDPQMVDRYRIHLTLVENKIDARSRETLVLNNRMLSKEVAKSFWDYLWGVMDNHNWYPKHGKSRPDPEFDLAFKTLFGTFEFPLSSCLVNTAVIRAGTWNDPELREFLGEFYSWSEFGGVTNFGAAGPPSTSPLLSLDSNDIVLVNGQLAGNGTLANNELTEYFDWKLNAKWKRLDGRPITGKEMRHEKITVDLSRGSGKITLDKKPQQQFFFAWREIMATQRMDSEEKDDIGYSSYRLYLHKEFKRGIARPKQKLRDLWFKEIWERNDPSDWQHLDRNHRLWAAKRERYIRRRVYPSNVNVTGAIKTAISAYRIFDSVVLGNEQVVPLSPYYKGSLDPAKLSGNLKDNVKSLSDEWKRMHPPSEVGTNSFMAGLAGVDNTAVTLWSRARVQASYNKIYMITMNLPDTFPNWKIRGQDPQKYIDSKVGLPLSHDQSTKRDLSQLSCYPDFALPTYRQLFTIDGVLNDVWALFAPTAESLGISSIERQHLKKTGEDYLIAVKPEAIIEPTFYFAKGKYKKLMQQAKASLLADEAIYTATKTRSFVELEVTMDNFNQIAQGAKNPGKAKARHLHQLISTLLKRDEVSEYINKNAKTKIKEFLDPDSLIDQLYLTSKNNTVIAVAKRDPDDPTGQKFNVELVDHPEPKSISFLDNSSAYDVDNPEKIRESLEEIMDRMPEDKQDVKRCFPTFRLRFIDFDTGLYTDEFYDYNALRSIHILHDKYDASTCELEIFNMTGVLDSDIFFTQGELDLLNIPDDDEPKQPGDERAGRYLKAIKLREGTSIQVLMGYSPDPELLSIVFTGRISQVQMGTVVKIIAQGYKTELLNEISFKTEGKPLSKVVRNVFQHLDGEGGKDLHKIKNEDKKNGTPHLGVRTDIASAAQVQEYNQSILDIFSVDKIRMDHSNIPEGNWVGGGLHETVPAYTVNGRTYFDLFGDKPSRYRNIHLQNFTQNNWKQWLCSYQSGFDSFLEMTSFMPGWVCEVVPYDHLATLYIGPPEGKYHFTSKYNREIVRGLRFNHPTRKQIIDEADVLDMMGRFYTYATRWINKKRRDGKAEKLGKDDRVKTSWLPSPHDTGDVAGLLSSMRKKNERVFRALIGAFFGFDLITKGDFPSEVSGTLWHVVEYIANTDEIIQGAEISGTLWGDYEPEINIKFQESAKHTLETLINKSLGMKNKLYQISFFPDRKVQRTVGRLSYLRNWPSSTFTEVKGIESLDDVTYLELASARGGLSSEEQESYEAYGKARRGEESKYSSGSITDHDRLTEQELLNKRGTETRDELYSPKNLLPHNAIISLAKATYRKMTGKKVVGDVWNIPMACPRSFPERLGSLVGNSLEELKVYMYLMHKFLEEEESPANLRLMGESLVSLQLRYREPDMKPFRDMHHVCSRYDIIQNNIAASMKEMANTVLLRYASSTPHATEVKNDAGGSSWFMDYEDTKWKAFKNPDGIPFHRDIKLEQKKLGISVEKNALTEEMASFVFLNRMGEAIRPMYRGNILLWGRAIKPFDVVWIDDGFNSMKGPVEAERVIHHFTIETGWTTTVVPHAYVHVNNSVEIFQVTVLAKWLDGISSALEIAEWGGLILGLLSMGAGSVAVKAGTMAVGGFLKKALVAGANKALRRKMKKEVIKATTESAFAAVEKSVLKGGTDQLAKEIGRSCAPALKSGIRSAGLWGGSMLAGHIADTWSSNLAISASEDMQGIVSFTPLMFEGRPLVAGMDYDDRFYVSQAGQMWQNIGKRFSNIFKFLREEISDGYGLGRRLGIANEKEDTTYNPGYGSNPFEED